jgi:signal transduction histidine kinase
LLTTDLRRHFLQLFLPVLVLVVGGVVFYGKSDIEQQLTLLQARENLNVGRGATVMAGKLDDIARDLAYLSTYPILRNAVDEGSPASIDELAKAFASFSSSKAIYDQLRWIDETGMERVRVDYVGGKAVVIAEDQLQNKGKRYFFTDSFKLSPGEIFVSPLDLNIEHNAIEVPYKPMVRVATPVVDSQGNKRGIVILNYYGRLLVDAFSEATDDVRDHIMALNGDGYWLKSPQPEDEWGFMFKQPERSLAARAPAAWQRIRAQDNGQELLADGLWTWQTVYPLKAGQRSSTGAAEAFVPSRGEVETREYVWKVVAHLSEDKLAAISRPVWQRLWWVGAVLLSLFGFGSFKLAQAMSQRDAAEAKVRRANAELEMAVAERTRQLNEKLVELDEANAELARKNDEMEAMIYSASHDLRSPLVNIQGFSQRLEKGIADIATRLAQPDVPADVPADLNKLIKERIPTALGFIKSSSLKMDSLINGLLRMSRAGRAQLSIQALDMDAMLKDITQTLAIQIQQADVSVVIEPLPPCLADAPQLNQVFTNLLDNAIKYRDPARPLEVRVSGESLGKTVRYVVADTGPGIPKEYQDKVWELFHRLDPTGPIAGEGLGLTLVRRILDRLRGQIRLESVPGQGSRFIIELPAAPSDEMTV